MNKLAQALGWSDETLEVATRSAADDRRRREIAYAVLRPHLEVARENYLHEGQKLIAYLREHGSLVGEG